MDKQGAHRQVAVSVCSFFRPLPLQASRKEIDKSGGHSTVETTYRQTFNWWCGDHCAALLGKVGIKVRVKVTSRRRSCLGSTAFASLCHRGSCGCHGARCSGRLASSKKCILDNLAA